MGGVDPLGVEAVERYESALVEAREKGVVVRGLLISNPHNPLGMYFPLIFPFHLAHSDYRAPPEDLVGLKTESTIGRCYTPESLKALFAFCGKHNIHLISDEIYALSVYDSCEPGAVPFTSVLSLEKEGLIEERYVHVLYGMSKVSTYLRLMI